MLVNNKIFIKTLRENFSQIEESYLGSHSRRGNNELIFKVKGTNIEIILVPKIYSIIDSSILYKPIFAYIQDGQPTPIPIEHILNDLSINSIFKEELLFNVDLFI